MISWDWQEYIKDFEPRCVTKISYPECGPGWFPLIYNLIQTIDQVLYSRALSEKIQVLQIKSKFGALRFYYDLSESDQGIIARHAVDSAIILAERMSYITCSLCGDRKSKDVSLCPKCEAAQKVHLS